MLDRTLYHIVHQSYLHSGNRSVRVEPEGGLPGFESWTQMLSPLGSGQPLTLPLCLPLCWWESSSASLDGLFVATMK